MKIDLKNIDQSWTLFLDRDGVINVEKEGGYINHWNEFVFQDGVKEAIKIFNPLFGRIFVVTNQRGLAKGDTLQVSLSGIHQNMFIEINKAGGRIDQIYFCGDLENSSPNRKPNPGMALQAKQDFPSIDFAKSIIVGNTPGDMEFGRNIGAITVFLPTTRKDITAEDHRVDFVFASLLDFARAL